MISLEQKQQMHSRHFRHSGQEEQHVPYLLMHRHIGYRHSMKMVCVFYPTDWQETCWSIIEGSPRQQEQWYGRFLKD
jgi:hypothetical protein